MIDTTTLKKSFLIAGSITTLFAAVYCADQGLYTLAVLFGMLCAMVATFEIQVPQ